MTKMTDMPFDFQIGHRGAAQGDRPVILYNPKNDRLFFDQDGAGGDKGVKIGKITIDAFPYPELVDLMDFQFGNRKAAVTADPTLIYNTKSGKLFIDPDGIGADKAIKVGFLDFDF